LEAPDYKQLRTKKPLNGVKFKRPNLTGILQALVAYHEFLSTKPGHPLPNQKDWCVIKDILSKEAYFQYTKQHGISGSKSSHNTRTKYLVGLPIDSILPPRDMALCLIIAFRYGGIILYPPSNPADKIDMLHEIGPPPEGSTDEKMQKKIEKYNAKKEVFDECESLRSPVRYTVNLLSEKVFKQVNKNKEWSLEARQLYNLIFERLTAFYATERKDYI
jgi:hypothetical protein